MGDALLGRNDLKTQEAVTFPRYYVRSSEFTSYFGLHALPVHTVVNASRTASRMLTRMTRGRRGSLDLHRMALSSTLRRGFIPAHTLIGRNFPDWNC